MEPKPTYTAAAISGIISCQTCQAPLAERIERDGKPLVRVGNLELYAAHGCCLCGAEWHWTTGDAILSRIIERAKTPLDQV
jgi:hypothetical protein